MRVDGQVGRGRAASLSYEIEPSRRLVAIICTGTVSVDLISDREAKLRAEPMFDPQFSLLADYTRADLSRLDVEAIRRLAQATAFSSGARRAFLVADNINHGLLREFCAYSEILGRGNLVEVFRDREAAVRWLAASAASDGD